MYINVYNCIYIYIYIVYRIRSCILLEVHDLLFIFRTLAIVSVEKKKNLILVLYFYTINAMLLRHDQVFGLLVYMN